ncbi:chemotaxis protein CheW, partial [Variovorax beijingensis]
MAEIMSPPQHRGAAAPATSSRLEVV